MKCREKIGNIYSKIQWNRIKYSQENGIEQRTGQKIGKYEAERQKGWQRGERETVEWNQFGVLSQF